MMAGVAFEALPSSGDLFEKPKPVKMGKVFKQKVVVQHRSDMLLQEQIENVQNVQDALKSALQELETAKNPEEIQFLEQQVSDLKERTDQMIVILKIVQKMNTELQYARSDLQKKLKLNDSDSDEINRTRKRVGWLEDRMEQVLGKKRQRSAHRAASLVLDPRSMMQADRNGGGVTRGGFMSDYSSSYIPRDQSARSSTNSPRQRAIHHFTNDSEASYPLPLHQKVEDIQNDIYEDESTTSQAQRDHKRKHRESGEYEEESASDAGPDDRTFITQYPDTQYTTDSPLKGSQKQTSSQDDPLALQYTDSQFSSEHQKPIPPIGMGVGTGRDESDERLKRGIDGDETSERAGTSTEGTDRTTTTQDDTPKKERVTPRTKQQRAVAAGIMKARQPPSRVSKEGSHVTILSPADELLAIEEMSHGEGDATDRYWNSEHHKFEYTEFRDDIIDMNPTSYHTMGLAVPGCFVDSIESGSRLPWRERSNSELSDVHPTKKKDLLDREGDWKVALDKLSVKIHKMYGRVKEASMLSVRPEVETKKGPSLLLQALESGDGPDTPCTLPPKPTLAKFGLMRPASEDIAGFPVVDPNAERLGTSMSGRLVYRPNPLPYPEKLPVTKVNRVKEYPPLSELYSLSVPGQDAAPGRIVDQRNLYNETKFTSSLFRSQMKSKRSVESPDPVAEEENIRPPPREIADESKKKKKRRKKHKEEYDIPIGKPGIKGAFNMAKAAVKFRGQQKWGDMKPKSGALKHTGLKWERVKSIVHNNLVSNNDDERIDAARHLGLLRVCDTMVLYALRERLKNDSENRVIYESAKSLITLGCWDEEALNVIVNYLINGNTHVRADLIKTMIFARNVQYIDKRISAFSDLVRILSVMCKVEKAEDRMSFDAAVCMGRMCVYDDNAKARLRLVVNTSKDTHMRAEALDILIRQMNQKSKDIVLVLVDQLNKSSVWKYRVDACKLMIALGTKYATPNEVVGMQVYEVLEKKLWDDPSHNVRYEAAKAMAALDFYPVACEKVEKKLEDQNEEIRAQAVIAVGTLGMRNGRILRHLLEMIDLDSSEYVRLMIIRTFTSLHCIDKRVIRILKDKERGEGVLSREATKALEYLDGYAKLMEQRKRKKKHKSTAGSKSSSNSSFN